MSITMTLSSLSLLSSLLLFDIIIIIHSIGIVLLFHIRILIECIPFTHMQPYHCYHPIVDIIDAIFVCQLLLFLLLLFLPLSAMMMIQVTMLTLPQFDTHIFITYKIEWPMKYILRYFWLRHAYVLCTNPS